MRTKPIQPPRGCFRGSDGSWPEELELTLGPFGDEVLPVGQKLCEFLELGDRMSRLDLLQSICGISIFSFHVPSMLQLVLLFLFLFGACCRKALVQLKLVRQHPFSSRRAN